MGEYVGVSIGNYEFISYKNTFGDLLSIFNEDDLKMEEAYDPEREETVVRRYFTTTVGKAKMALDVMGNTIKKAQDLFEYNKKDYIECFAEWAESEKNIEKIREEYTFSNWCEAVKKYAAILVRDKWNGDVYENLQICRSENNTISEQSVLESLPDWMNDSFWGIDLAYLDPEVGTVWEVFRVILEAFDSEEEIILDYTDLYEGGWCEEIPDEKLFSVPKTVILTEGNTDALVISAAMKLLYPHMTKHYSFINFEEYNVQGSTNFLTHYLKAFIAAGIENKMIALYDNDSAGLSEIKGLKKIDIPSNVRIMHLPDLEFCQNYPTIGPNGKRIDNINGRACSIEMFFGRDVLQKDGEWEPVRWKAYLEKAEAYQGEIIAKKEVTARFEEKVKRSQNNLVREEWKSCDLLLQQIFQAFQE